MNGNALARNQFWLCLAAIVAGIAVGRAAPGAAPVFAGLLWPALMLLLAAGFVSVPLTGLREAARDRRFLAGLIAGNFLLVPPIVWGIVMLLPDEPALRLGVALVLLVPCTDWFVAFTVLSGGDGRKAVMATPLLLITQFASLPLWLWLIAPAAGVALIEPSRALAAFALLVLAPLLLAHMLRRRGDSGDRLAGRAARGLEGAMVPLLAVVVFLVAAAQSPAVVGQISALGTLFGAYALYLAAALALGVLLGRLLALEAEAGRALTFSLGTRNSFVVLPIALSLPAGAEVAAVAVVFQSLVELGGMLVYLRVVPRLIAR